MRRRRAAGVATRTKNPWGDEETSIMKRIAAPASGDRVNT